MKLFHRHSWVIQHQRFNPPQHKAVGTIVSDYFQRQAFGFTNTTLWCKDCGAVKIQTVYGDATKSEESKP